MRPIFAVIIGVVFGGFFIALGEMILEYVYPSLNAPSNLDSSNMQLFVDQIPLFAKIAIVMNWGVAGFVGATVTTFIQGRTHFKPMLATIGILQLLTYMNMMILWGHPVWMWIAATFIYVIVGFISYFLIRKKSA